MLKTTSAGENHVLRVNNGSWDKFGCRQWKRLERARTGSLDKNVAEQLKMVKTTSSGNNRVLRMNTGSRDKFGRYRWKRLERTHICAFDPKCVKTGKKLNPGRSG